MEKTGIMRTGLSPNQEITLQRQQLTMRVFESTKCSSTDVPIESYLNKKTHLLLGLS